MLSRTSTSLQHASIAAALRHAPLWLDAAVINGEPVRSATVLDVHSPCTGHVIGHIPNLGAAETRAAIDAANVAFRSWSARTAMSRSRILWKWAELMNTHAEDLALIMSAESGKPFAEALGENAYSRQFVEWFAGEAERVYGDIIPPSRAGVRALVRKEPIGVVGVVTPWNFPSAMITRAVAAAFAAGCTVVLKPSELTPFSATALAVLAKEAGIPNGVFNVVTGLAPPIGSALCESPIVRKLSFTGSTAVGKLLYQQCASTVKKLSLELGGNAPFIVCGDADLSAFLDGVMSSKFRNCGQACIASNRIYIAASVHDAFVRALIERVRALRLGNGGSPRLSGTDPNVTLGPLITPAAAKKTAALVAEAVAEGAVVACGGKAPPGLPANFFEPTVLTNVSSEMKIANCEVFGPVASIIKFDDQKLDEVVAAANNTPAGLAAYVFTTDYKKQWYLAEALQYGMVGVNEGAISNPSCPFGGVKQSGLGRDGSKYGIESYLEPKYMLMGKI